MLSSKNHRLLLGRRTAACVPLPRGGGQVLGDVTDLTRAQSGWERIRWADGEMPVLRAIRERFGISPACSAAVRPRICLPQDRPLTL